MLNIASAVLVPNRLCFTDHKFSVNRRNSAYHTGQSPPTAKILCEIYYNNGKTDYY